MAVTLYFIRYFSWALLYCSPLLIFFSLIIFGTGYLVGRLEKWSWTDTIYWTIITATTVGYGDFKPSKYRSRIFTIIVVLVGMMFTGVIVAITISATTESLKKHINVDNVRNRFVQSTQDK
ncbi:MAG: two pore domain potassium channel family protein [Lentisphaeria bacterium]|nr:two pore domain potassium channel family protein [Lentisphaeria bacterium]